MQRIILWMAGAQAILAGLVFSLIVTSAGDARRYGDNLQIALPVLALACEASRGAAGEFALRFAAMMTLAHGTKRILGEAPANRRPGGGGHGFPSAHTAAATLGASALAHACLRSTPTVQAAVILAAAFVGASRIQVGAHDIWQVLAGALLGFGCDRLVRREGPSRDRLCRALADLSRRFGPRRRGWQSVLPRALLAARTRTAGIRAATSRLRRPRLRHPSLWRPHFWHPRLRNPRLWRPSLRDPDRAPSPADPATTRAMTAAPRPTAPSFGPTRRST